MKKAGIVTFHHAQSYGALLQTYALQQLMLDNGIDNEVVNYRCKFLEERTHPFRYFKEKTLRQYVVSFLYARQMLEQTLLSNPAWQSLTAVKEGRFHVLEHELYNLKPNARWAESYRILYETLTEE